MWVRQFGTGDFDVASDLATDSTGNVYVGGWMSAASEDADSWLAKLDGSGNLLWVRAFGIPALDQVEGVSADPSGFVYVVGLVEGRFAGQTSASGWDAYIAKWDVAGNLVWLRQFGSEHTEQASAVALDASGIYISGEIDYGGGAGFLTKYDADGDQQWFERVGLGVGVWVSALAVDAPSAAIFVGGTAWGAFPGQSLRGPTDAFVARYGPDGQPHWIRQFGTDGVDNASGVATDGAGGIYIGGDTSGDAAGSYDGVLMRVHGRLQSLHVETPNTRTHWGIGTVQRIAWWYDGSAGEFEIEVSRGDDSWESVAIVANRAGTSQSLYWTVTGPTTTSARIRVTALGSDATDTNDVSISIAEPFISILRPVRDADVEAGSDVRIFFEHNLGARAPIAIDVTEDGGTSWQPIVANSRTTGSRTSSFQWRVGTALSGPLQLRIRAVDGSGAIGVSGVFSAHAPPAPAMWTLHVLGPNLRATAINDRSDIVGGADGSPFVWTVKDGIRLLDDLPGARATDINNQGQVVGIEPGGGSEMDLGFLWSAATGPVHLGTFLPDAINDNGLIGGAARTGDIRSGTLPLGRRNSYADCSAVTVGWVLLYGHLGESARGRCRMRAAGRLRSVLANQRRRSRVLGDPAWRLCCRTPSPE